MCAPPDFAELVEGAGTDGPTVAARLLPDAAGAAGAGREARPEPA
ncbi:hypothetical protein OG444_20620 [Streptomyces sp. NBC_01232]|nr:hypothetical protein OG444_20620 [Streptomyces sp. NBC_01232]